MDESQFATKADLQLLKKDLKEDLKEELKFALDGLLHPIITEMSVRFGEVNQRLDRIDATLVNHGKQIAAGGRSIAGLNEWIGKADADYARVLEELADLKLRVARLERPEATP